MKNRGALTTRLVTLLTSGAVALGVFLAPRAAHAAEIGADLDLAFPLDSKASTGWGFAGRVGANLHVPLVALEPEAVFSYYHLGGTFSSNLYDASAGLRLGIGEIIRPGVSGHLGIGHLSPTFGPNQTGFLWDAGIFLEFTAIPLLNVGVHGAYNHLNVGDSFSDVTKWFSVGVDATLVF